MRLREQLCTLHRGTCWDLLLLFARYSCPYTCSLWTGPRYTLSQDKSTSCSGYCHLILIKLKRSTLELFLQFYVMLLLRNGVEKPRLTLCRLLQTSVNRELTSDCRLHFVVFGEAGEAITTSLPRQQKTTLRYPLLTAVTSNESCPGHRPYVLQCSSCFLLD